MTNLTGEFGGIKRQQNKEKVASSCQSIIDNSYGCPSKSYDECLALYTKGICWKNQPDGAKNHYSLDADKMEFIGCCLNGELYEDCGGIIYLKRYINVDLELLAWGGEESDTHRETVDEFEIYTSSHTSKTTEEK